ncbi:BspA family leucine-rich repeat surface protein [Bifidobacterium sp. ESL0745]|uniref:BspA family leucine-rich repeat surface protein n=1 Tax=Bifidobacterium sp. ESL0745 TaxID=2983226 RepID=UPI0023F9FED4|nr:BspA family leucine-rich repeat surface protein [Bifidobacterium sp. ESL0745]MDF7665843.1 BspA family leucine-rich repeat surface protein [Bifidobacterium sp. ESL0745]
MTNYQKKSINKRNITAVAIAAAIGLALAPQTAVAAEHRPYDAEQTPASRAYCTPGKRPFGTDAYWEISSDCSELHLGSKYERVGTLPNTRPWYTIRYSVKRVTVDSPVKAHVDSSKMFFDMPYLTSIDLTGLDTSDATNMNQMFYKNPSLGSITLGDKFDTGNVTDMSYMFASNSTLKTLDLEQKFDTSNVTNMNHMFGGMKSVMSINMGSSFSTQNVFTMNSMFQGDEALRRLDLSGFDTRKINANERMDNMFEGCTNLRFVRVGANAAFKDEANAPSASWKSQDDNWTGDPALGFGQDSPNATWYGKPEVSVKFNANGAQGAAPATLTRDAWPGAPAKFEMPGPGEMTKKDHTLAGWAHNEDASEPHYQSGSILTLDNDGDSTDDTTMHAIWQRTGSEGGAAPGEGETAPDGSETGADGSETGTGADGTETGESETAPGEGETGQGGDEGESTGEGDSETPGGETEPTDEATGTGGNETTSEETGAESTGNGTDTSADNAESGANPTAPTQPGHKPIHTNPAHTGQTTAGTEDVALHSPTHTPALLEKPGTITTASDRQLTDNTTESQQGHDQQQGELARTGSSVFTLAITAITMALIGLAISLRQSSTHRRSI